MGSRTAGRGVEFGPAFRTARLSEALQASGTIWGAGPRVAAAQQPGAMEEFPFRERAGGWCSRAGKLIAGWVMEGVPDRERASEGSSCARGRRRLGDRGVLTHRLGNLCHGLRPFGPPPNPLPH